MKRLCRYPSDSKSVQKADIDLAVKEAQRHILEAHAERLTEETGMGDARLERAAFGSGDQRSIHLS